MRSSLLESASRVDWMAEAEEKTRRFGQINCPSSRVNNRRAFGGTYRVRADVGESTGFVCRPLGLSWRNLAGKQVSR